MIGVEGTRQINSVTSGEGVPFIWLFLYKWCYKKGNSDCLLKTQDSALNCEMMYGVWDLPGVGKVKK